MKALLRVGAALAVLMIGLADPTSAANDTERCEWVKKKSAGKYARCRLLAEAGFAKAGDLGELQDRLARCGAKLLRAYSKAETRHGAACPTTGDGEAVHEFLRATTSEIAAFLAGDLDSLAAGVCGEGTVYDVASGSCQSAPADCGRGTVFSADTGQCEAEVLFRPRDEDIGQGYEWGGTAIGWAPLASAPEGGSFRAVTVLDGLVYAAGGVGTTALERYDLHANEWTSLAPLPEERSFAGAAATGGAVYVVGGHDGSRQTLASALRYDPVANGWSEVSAMATPRWNVAVVAVGGLVYALGGLTPDGWTDSVEAYDPATDSWSGRAPMLGEGTRGAVEFGGKIYAWGHDGFLQEYDPMMDQWRALSHVGAIDGQAVAATTTHLFQFGGFDLTPLYPYLLVHRMTTRSPVDVQQTETFGMYREGNGHTGDWGHSAVAVGDRVLVLSSGQSLREFLYRTPFALSSN